jgi:hypothetical protein
VKYLSPAEIADEMYSKLDDQSRSAILEIEDPEEMIQFHHGVGTGIRNTYGLWERDNPYTVINPEPNEEGVIDDPRFPDQVSHDVLVRLWHHVHGIPYSEPPTMEDYMNARKSERETSDDVSSMAAQLVNFTVDRLDPAIPSDERLKLAARIRSVAASALAQDRTPGRRLARAVKKVLGFG